MKVETNLKIIKCIRRVLCYSQQRSWTMVSNNSSRRKKIRIVSLNLDYMHMKLDHCPSHKEKHVVSDNQLNIVRSHNQLLVSVNFFYIDQKERLYLPL